MREQCAARSLGRLGPDIEGHHAAALARLLAHGEFMLRVRSQTGVVNTRHAGLRLKPLRERQRAGAVRLHADAQRLHALENHPGVERRQRHAGGTHHRSEHACYQ